MWCQRLLLTGRCYRSSFKIRHKIWNRSQVAGVILRENSCLVSAPYTWNLFRPRHGAANVIKVCHYHESSPKIKNSVSENSEKPHKFLIFLKWGMAILFVAALGSIPIIWWQVLDLHRGLSMVTSIHSHHMESQDADKSEHKHEFFDNHAMEWLKWVQSRSENPYTLLTLCTSENHTIRTLAIKVMADKKNWHDYQYRYVAQAGDTRTLIGLSRSRGSDPRFFRPLQPLIKTQRPLIEEVAATLVRLEHRYSQDHSCTEKGRPLMSRVAAEAEHILRHEHEAHDDDTIYFWGFDGSPMDIASMHGEPPEDKALLEFLNAVAHLCTHAYLASQFIDEDGLAVLQRVIEKYSDSIALCTAVAAVLGNLALHPCFHGDMAHTGWLGVLKGWAEGHNSTLAVYAARVLYNLDRDWNSLFLPESIVQLHPLWRTRKTLHADVVFVHGLLGGAVMTWRQQDLDKSKTPPPNAGQPPRTDCWPKDWLADDCPHIRILSVHYDSAISTWSVNSDHNKEKLECRGQDILEKLTQAGVGIRPIIWVGHSMGGLLIKEMMLQCQMGELDDHKAKRQQTCGFLFYAVPHKGMSRADITKYAPYIFYPSVEMRELSTYTPHLMELQKNFMQFVDNGGIPCLSFGELIKTRFSNLLPTILLVPPESSNPDCGEFMEMSLNHIDTCKPASRTSLLYRNTVAFLHRAIFFSYMHRLRQAMSDVLD